MIECISWTIKHLISLMHGIKQLISLMHGITMKIKGTEKIVYIAVLYYFLFDSD